MYQTSTVEETDGNRVGTLLLIVVAALLLLVLAVFVALFQPEWVNFLWLSVATVSLAALAGWVIGHFLDALFDDVL